MINARVAALPGLRLVGNAYDGIGVPDCIRLGAQGGAGAARLAARYRRAWLAQTSNRVPRIL